MYLLALNLVSNSTQFEPITTQYVSISMHHNTISVPAKIQWNSFITWFNQTNEQSLPQGKCNLMLLVSVKLSIKIECLDTTFTIGVFIP